MGVVCGDAGGPARVKGLMTPRIRIVALIAANFAALFSYLFSYPASRRHAGVRVSYRYPPAGEMFRLASILQGSVQILARNRLEVECMWIGLYALCGFLVRSLPLLPGPGAGRGSWIAHADRDAVRNLNQLDKVTKHLQPYRQADKTLVRKSS